MIQIQGGCHCGNLSYVATLTNDPSAYYPRACDCQFCMAHGATYISDAEGGLTITIKNEDAVNRYKQGSGVCDFLICRNCGVLTNVTFTDGGDIFGSINARSIGSHISLGQTEAAHLVELSNEERIDRWKKIWFPGVNIRYENA